MAKSDKVASLEAQLKEEKQERNEAEERAARANDRAQQAEDALRKLQLETALGRDVVEALKKRVEALESERARAESDKPASAPPKPATEMKSAPPKSDGVAQMLERVESLRQLLAHASVQLSELHAEEAALATKRTRVLGDVCGLLARAVGTSGEGPPPVPLSILEKRLTTAPAVDISEVAELLESLRPPAPPKVE